jgi:hypothetical protein
MENEGRQQYIGMGASDVPETSNFSDLDLHQLRRSTNICAGFWYTREP